MRIQNLILLVFLFRVQCNPCNLSAYSGGLSSRINSAIQDLPPSGGIIDARDMQGEISQPIYIPDNTQLLLGYGTYSIKAVITMGGQSSIVGMPTGSTTGLGGASGTYLQAGADINNLISINGNHSVLQNLIIDGNKANYSISNGVIVNGGRAWLNSITVQKFSGNGILLKSGSAASKIFNVMAISNGQTGLFVKSDDLFITQSTFENNGYDGLTLDASGLRVTNSDFGGNQRFGFYSVNLSGVNIIDGNQFGNNCLTDLYLSGSTGHNIISDNAFIGSGCRQDGQSAIFMQQNYGNVISGNMIVMTNAGLPSLSYGIRFDNPGAASNVEGNIIDNTGGSGAPITAPPWMPLNDNVIIQ